MLKLLIEPNGEITAIYSDDLADLCDQGRAEIWRVSEVEHLPARGNGWTAKMLSPVGEPIVTLGPFRLRETALAAEVDYLERILGL